MELFNIKFVGEVEKHPELYDYNLREYSRKDCAEKAWNEIAKAVNMSAAECKEKWRNLRSSFVKNLKPKPSGSGATKKKPYYLTEAMQFAVPFVKVAGTITGNLPQQIVEQRPSPSTTPVVDMEVSQEESVFSEDILSEHHSSSPSPRPPSPRPPSTPLPQPTPPPVSPVDHETPSVSTDTGQRGPRGRKRKTQTMQSDADKAIAEYFGAKAQKISNIPSTDLRREGIQNFLNSLIPDLIQFNDVQLRNYKRRALQLVDEIIGTTPEIANPIVNPNNVSQTFHFVQSQTTSTSDVGSTQSSEEVPFYQLL